MNLIKISSTPIGNNKINSVDARELHAFLGSRRDFSSWVKAKVINNPFFEEGQDYILLTKSGEAQPCGSQPSSHNRKDYALTMDTAKKVSMSEQTAKGEEARNYFLECERRAKDQQLKPMSQLEMVSVLASQAVENEKQLTTLTKDVDHIKHHLTTNGCVMGYIPMKDAHFSYGHMFSEQLFRDVVKAYKHPTKRYRFKTQQGTEAVGLSVKEMGLEGIIGMFLKSCTPVTRLFHTSPMFGDRRFKIIKAVEPEDNKDPDLTTPEMTYRGEISRTIRRYATDEKQSFSDVWNNLYCEVKYRCKVDLKIRAKNQGKKPLDIAEDLNMIPQVLALAVELFGTK